MKNWFNLNLVWDIPQRTFGVVFRSFGIDVSVMLLGWANDWKIIDVRIPVNYGVYAQVLFLMVSIGRLPIDTYDRQINHDS